MDRNRDARNLATSELFRELIESWRVDCYARFEQTAVNDLDGLVACRIRLVAVEEFRDYVIDQLAKIIKSDASIATPTNAAH